MQGLTADLKYAIRFAIRKKAFTALAVLILAVAIASNVVVFSLVDALVLRDPPFPDVKRLVRLFEISPKGQRPGVASESLRMWREHCASFDSFGTFGVLDVNISSSGPPEVVLGARVNPELMRLIGVQPHVGRTIHEGDELRSAQPVAMLDHAFWVRRFGARSNIVGERLILNGEPRVVIGVVRPGLQFLRYRPAIWIPHRIQTESESSRFDRNLDIVVGHLTPGHSLESAEAEMKVVARRAAVAFPKTHSRWQIGLTRLETFDAPGFRSKTLSLLAFVIVLLLMGCGNLSSLLLARAFERDQEMAVRIAIGAQRWQLYRQTLMESFVLAALGGVVGTLLAFGILPLALRILPAQMANQIYGGPSSVQIAIPTLLYVLLLVGVTFVIFGVLPAVRAACGSPVAWLRAGANTPAPRFLRGMRADGVLMAVEFALATVLLGAAGLFAAAFLRLGSTETGLTADGIVTLWFQPDASRFGATESRLAFYDRILAEIAAVPGVASVAGADLLPSHYGQGNTAIRVEGDDSVGDSDSLRTLVRAIDANYMPTLGIPLLRGRPISDRDRLGVTNVALISDSTSRRLFPGRDPVGARVVLGAKDSVAYQIVGVTADVKMPLENEMPPVVYVPLRQWPPAWMYLIVRTNEIPEVVAEKVRQVVWRANPEQAVEGPWLLAESIAEQLGPLRFSAQFMALFSGIGLALATSGIYATTLYSVSSRTKEMALRSALGASGPHLVWLVVRSGITVSAIGIAIGACALFVLRRSALSAFELPGTPDPRVLGGVLLFLLLLSVLACYVPARRAALSNPASTLRSV